jgi:hypothetical protein
MIPPEKGLGVEAIRALACWTGVLPLAVRDI